MPPRKSTEVTLTAAQKKMFGGYDATYKKPKAAKK